MKRETIESLFQTEGIKKILEYPQKPGYKKQQDECAILQEQILQQLNLEQKEIFWKMDNLEGGLRFFETQAAFVQGFVLATNIMTEAMIKDD